MPKIAFANRVHSPNIRLRSQDELVPKHKVPRLAPRMQQSYKPEGNRSYRTSTVDFRITRSRVNCLFGARIVAVGPYGRNAAKENAEELNMTWNGIGCVMLNTRDTGRYSYSKDFRQDGPRSNGAARW